LISSEVLTSLDKTTVVVSGKGLITRVPRNVIKALDIKKGDCLLWEVNDSQKAIVIKVIR